MYASTSSSDTTRSHKSRCGGDMDEPEGGWRVVVLLLLLLLLVVVVVVVVFSFRAP